METTYFEDLEVHTKDFTEVPLVPGNYENCSFSHCNFSSSSLSGISFAECNFIHCNLSMVQLHNTALKDVKFKDCKLLGMHFEHCSPFLLKLHFESCILDLCSFYKLKLAKTPFTHCSLKETDLTETDLSNVLFNDCDMQGAIFYNTILEKADLRTAYNYVLDPENNRLKKARFSLQGITGLLHKYDIFIE